MTTEIIDNALIDKFSYVMRAYDEHKPYSSDKARRAGTVLESKRNRLSGYLISHRLVDTYHRLLDICLVNQ
jgi:hypothetical protein